MKLIRITGIVAALGITQAAHAVGNTPINTPERAARSALYLLELPNTLTQQINDFDYQARVIIEHGFDQLDAATTVQALLAAPRGIVVTCRQRAAQGAPNSRKCARIASAVRRAWTCIRSSPLTTLITR
jgi:hypothetical protein